MCTSNPRLLKFDKYEMMKSQFLYGLLLACILSVGAMAQPEVRYYADLGSNQASNGFYVHNGLITNYTLKDFEFSFGGQLNLINSNNVFLSGLKSQISSDFELNTKTFNLQGFYLYLPFSPFVKEIDFGLIGSYSTPAFDFKLGGNFRQYSLRRSVRQEADFETTRILENWNLMYLLRYRLKPIGSNWNLALSLTNFDYFLINQETNPVLALSGDYRFNESLKCFAEIWYKTAGAFNLNVNYFGYFVRTGIEWRIKY